MMWAASFDSVTDVIGIPLAILALAALVTLDLRGLRRQHVARLLDRRVALIVAVVIVLVAVRFAVLA